MDFFAYYVPRGNDWREHRVAESTPEVQRYSAPAFCGFVPKRHANGWLRVAAERLEDRAHIKVCQSCAHNVAT